MSAAPDQRDWAPRNLAGGIYCSPACRFCTKAAHDAAVAAANKLAAEIGDGWKPRVWENMGWHWSAKKAHAAVHFSRLSETYTAYINGKDVQVIGCGATARDAVADGLAKLDALIEQLQRERQALVGVSA